ncbi:MAG TPA: FtsX-like permease family protein [Bacteroidetes bacterium]|nr:FtsX-like permease family protein [Bacteroidota bacterium]
MPIPEKNITRRRLKSSYVTSLISITLVLFLLGLVGLLILDARKLSDYLKESFGFSVMIKANAKDVEIRLFQKTLDAQVYVKSTRFVPKDIAASELQKELGEDFLQVLGYNPLLSSIDVYLKADYAQPDTIKKIISEIKKSPIVKEVYYQKSLLHAINQNVSKISLILLTFSFLLLLIAVTLINNTVRLMVYSKRFIINTMQLVGASSGFIRRPMLLRGIIQGMLGGFLAAGMVTGIIYLLQKEFKDFYLIQNYENIVILMTGMIVLGILLTLISTFFAINKYLSVDEDKLYY